MLVELKGVVVEDNPDEEAEVVGEGAVVVVGAAGVVVGEVVTGAPGGSVAANEDDQSLCFFGP